ncbi:MAG: response regulator [Phycisphaerae bacterium]|nr:response regulator [Saprospiraceae bacterium]
MKRIHYVLDYQANQGLTLGIDRKRLEKVINNLISNALKFTQPEGEVKLSILEQTSNDDGQALINIRVADTGRGIPTEDIPHLFERYFQTKRHDLATAGGTGIGLALAKELALLMKGDLLVESEWGNGSVFSLSLPLKKVQGMAVQVPEVPSEDIQMTDPVQVTQPERISIIPSDGQTTRDHILLVEDNPDMQALLQSLLSADYQLTVANDGQEAWGLLEADEAGSLQFSLILSDVMMPRMDGYELLTNLKAHAHWRQTPVILLTARAEQDDKIQALRLGVDDYLVKPFSPPELSARISNLIANYRSRQAFIEKAVPDISFEKVEARDEVWLKTIETAAKHALDKGLPLQVGYLVDAGAVSERQFFREIKRLTGLTPNQYIQEVRLQKARHLLQQRAYSTLSEVAYAVGFDTPTYFTRVFEQHFGKHPSAYLQQSSMLEPGVFS